MNASNPFFLSRSPSLSLFNDLFLGFSAYTVDVSPIFGLGGAFEVAELASL